MTPWRAIAVAMAVLGYAALSHWLLTVDPSRPWLVAAPMLPVLGLAVLSAAWKRHWGLALGAAGLACMFAAAALWGRPGDVGHLYLLQHAGVHLALAWTFGITLRRGAVPLITRLARLVHREVPPAMVAYTGRLTAVWAGYFIAMVLMSLLLYRFAPWHWWSIFVNVITPVAVAAMFIVEHWLRYHLHPEFERVSIWHAVQAFRRATARQPG